MKATILFLLLSVTVSAQTFSYKPSTVGDVETSETITVQGKEFGIFKTASGSKFIKAVSKSGNVYPVWIGTLTEFVFPEDDLPIRVSKNGTHFVLVLNKAGYPYAKYLEKNT